VALVIGVIELAGITAERLQATGSFWIWVEGIDLNTLGLVIVAMFVATWAVSLAVWHFGRIEERWSVEPRRNV
jgi:high-affinity nickel-transport protein